MITALEIENFKGIAARQHIEFAPLTPNSPIDIAGRASIFVGIFRAGRAGRARGAFQHFRGVFSPFPGRPHAIRRMVGEVKARTADLL